MLTGQPAWSCDDLQIWRDWWHRTPKDEIIQGFVLPSKGEVCSDPAALAMALCVALQGTGFVSPNPLVGCVILSKEKRFLSAGAHLKYGEQHAEVYALSQLSNDELRDSLLYVTLEPCAHHGKTPPCTDKILSLPISEVHYISDDPNPLVSGQGLKRIEQQGIQVVHHKEWQPEGEQLAEIFLHNHHTGKVFVGMKVASTPSGIYASKGSSRLWITGDRSRAYGHYLRQRYDAILVGDRTVRLDNPTLTVRSKVFNPRHPKRIVLDFKGTTLSEPLNLYRRADAETLVITREGTKYSTRFPDHVSVLEIPSEDGRFYWNDILAILELRKIKSVLLEGGNSVWSSAIQQKVVHKVHWFIGPEQDFKDDVLRCDPNTWRSEFIDDLFTLGYDRYMEVRAPFENLPFSRLETT